MNPILKFYYPIEEIEGTFYCDKCHDGTPTCEYNRKSRVARWQCVACGFTNIVKDVNFE